MRAAATQRVSSLRLTAKNSKRKREYVQQQLLNCCVTVNLLCFVLLFSPSLFHSFPLRLTLVLLNAIADIPAERKIVVLDATTVKIVDAICTLNDILDSGVYLVETVEKRRQPYPTMDAVYFIAPSSSANAADTSSASASLVIKDFSEKIPTYKAIHLFFTRGKLV